MENVTSSDGTTIAFDRSGEGPPVVVVGPAFSQLRYQTWYGWPSY